MFKVMYSILKNWIWHNKKTVVDTVESILCRYYVSWKENKNEYSCIFDFPKQDYIQCVFRWTFEFVFPDHLQNPRKCVSKKCINKSSYYNYLYKLYIRLYFYSDMGCFLLLDTLFPHKCMTPSKTQRKQMKNRNCFIIQVAIIWQTSVLDTRFSSLFSFHLCFNSMLCSSLASFIKFSK